MFQNVGKSLIIIGAIILIIGIVLLFKDRLPVRFLGNLPGDLSIKKEKWSFYFPIMTCILISVLLNFIFWVMNRFK